MKTINVTASKSYDVLIGSGLLKDLGTNLLSVLNKTCKVAIISDSNVWPIYGNAAKESLENAINAIGSRTAENVLKVTSADGKTTAYFNYETTSVIVPVAVDAQTGVAEYKVIAAQSYIIYTAG